MNQDKQSEVIERLRARLQRKHDRVHQTMRRPGLPLLAKITFGELEAIIEALSRPSLSTPSEDDPPCTDCGGSGITHQTERRCACQPPVQSTPSEGVIERLREALEPFARAAGVFSFSVGPDGIDDGLTVVAKAVAKPEYEATLSTADFTAAAAALARLSPLPLVEENQ